MFLYSLCLCASVPLCLCASARDLRNLAFRSQPKLVFFHQPNSPARNDRAGLLVVLQATMFLLSVIAANDCMRYHMELFCARRNIEGEGKSMEPTLAHRQIENATAPTAPSAGGPPDRDGKARLGKRSPYRTAYCFGVVSLGRRTRRPREASVSVEAVVWCRRGPALPEPRRGPFFVATGRSGWHSRLLHDRT